MPMKNPPHPGSVVLCECIEPLGLTITQAAQALGVTRTTLSERKFLAAARKAGLRSRLSTSLRRFRPGGYSLRGWP
jgi:hypothetical protein